MIDGVVGRLGELDRGLGDVTIAPTFALLRQDRAGVDAAVTAAITLPTGGRHDYLRDGFTLSPSIALGRSGRRIRVAAQLGYTARPASTLGATTIDDELFARIGAATPIAPRLELAAGASVATSAASPSAARAYAELLGSLSAQLTERAQLFTVGGLGVQDGFGAPDWRALGGVRYELP
jgi:hypothetical protein